MSETNAAYLWKNSAAVNGNAILVVSIKKSATSCEVNRLCADKTLFNRLREKLEASIERRNNAASLHIENRPFKERLDIRRAVREAKISRKLSASKTMVNACEFLTYRPLRPSTGRLQQAWHLSQFLNKVSK